MQFQLIQVTQFAVGGYTVQEDTVVVRAVAATVTHLSLHWGSLGRKTRPPWPWPRRGWCSRLLELGGGRALGRPASWARAGRPAMACRSGREGRAPSPPASRSGWGHRKRGIPSIGPKGPCCTCTQGADTDLQGSHPYIMNHVKAHNTSIPPRPNLGTYCKINV